MDLPRLVSAIVMFTCIAVSFSFGQISLLPYIERFDSVITPSLPTGWSTSSNRLASGDFFSTNVTPHSSPAAVQSSNSTVAQFLLSPVFDFSGRIPDKMRFWIARSGTHTSPLLVEASPDGGSSFPLLLGDTLRNPGTTGYVQTVLSLPESLINHQVTFRWRLIGGTGGTAGTFRMDDIEISVLTANDLAIGNGTVNPALPNTKDPLSLSFTVRNNGALASPGAAALFFVDENNDRAADPEEQFDHLTFSPLASGDSTALSVPHLPLSQGTHRFFAVVEFPADEIPSNDTSEIVVDVGVSPGTVVVNEIMYAPLGDEPEWVELFNTSGDTIDLKNWRISDNNISSKTLVTRSDFRIEPHSFVVVAKDSVIVLVHPDITVPVAFVNFPALNNTTDDGVVIFDERLLTIDSVRYSPRAQSGMSLERADPDAPSNDTSNWNFSLNSTGSTPGSVNSTVRRDLDLELGETNVFGNILSVLVTNRGRLQILSYNLMLSSDRNENGIPEETELITSIPSPGPLSPGESTFLTYDWSALPSGETTVILLLDVESDQRPANNVRIITVEQGFPRGSILINEIMYEPLSGKAEWFELFNPGNVPIDLRPWTFSGPSSSPVAIAASPEVIQPSGFAVVASDSSIYDFSPFPPLVPLLVLNRSGGFGLGNEGDNLVIRDGVGTDIDSVQYSPTWHQPALAETRGRSIERINPDLGSNDPLNWSTSADRRGGSPGTVNAIFAPRVPSATALSFSPNPFSPDGDGFEDFCMVSYRLPRTAALVRISIFDLRGRLIRMLAHSALSGQRGEILWDGLDDQKRQVRIGPHILLLEAADGKGNTVSTMKGVVVVATKL